MSALPLQPIPTISTKIDADVGATAVQARIPKLSPDVIHLIILALDGHAYNWKEFVAQLKSCALVGREWRSTAQQMLHRVVRISENKYKSTLQRYSANPSAVGKHEGWADGNIWRFPRVLILESSAPAPFSSWLEAPELQDFMERCTERITRLDFAHRDYNFNDIIACISGFPSVKRLDFRDATWTRTPSALANPAAFRHLRQINITHDMCHSLTDSICEVEAFAAWVRSTEREQPLRVLLFYNFRIHYEKQSCNLPNVLAGTLRVLSLDGVLRGAELLSATLPKPLWFPDLTLCNQLECITFNRWMLRFDGYVTMVIASITSPVLSTCRFYLDLRNDIPADLMMDKYVGLIGVAKLLSCDKKFPALERVVVKISYSYTPPQQEVVTALLSEQFKLLTQKRGIEVEYDFCDWTPVYSL